MIVNLLLAGLYVFSAVLIMHLVLGKVTGISGICHRTLREIQGWQVSFLLGMIFTGFLIRWTHPLRLPQFSTNQTERLNRWDCLRWVLAGFLVGYGSKYGCGCTSGHMLCGVARLSRRSIIASGTFFITALVIRAIFYSTSFLDAPIFELYTWTMFGYEFLQWLCLVLLVLLVSALASYRSLNVKYSNPIVAFIAGHLFAMGMGLSNMTKPRIVLGFLNLIARPSQFQPDLLYFFMTALIPFLLLYQLKLKKMEHTCLKEKIDMPSRTDIDLPLIVGSFIFGAGWGLCGVCPGPALVDLATLKYESISFIAAMIIGFKAA